MGEIASGEIRAEGVGRRFALRPLGTRSVKDVLVHPRRYQRHKMWALRDISFDVRPGETFGVIGRNGSGKSTLLKLMAYIFAPTEGELDVGGRVGSLLEVGAGFHPDFSGVENVYLSAAVHGLGKSYVDAHLDDILEFAEIGQYAHMPVKTYSTGMFLRLGFSVAIHIQPDVLLVDEVLAVGDEAFQKKCYEWIEGFQATGGTLVFVSHDPGAVERLCDRAIMLEQGRIAAEGTAHDVLRAYQRRLADERAAAVARPYDPSPGCCTILAAMAVGAEGAARERFSEGEPLVIEMHVRSERPLRDALLTVELHDDAGALVGARETKLDMGGGRDELVRLHLEPTPLRDGRYVGEVSIRSPDRKQELARRAPAFELIFVTKDPTENGPIRLGGRWELPEEQGQAVRKAAGH